METSRAILCVALFSACIPIPVGGATTIVMWGYGGDGQTNVPVGLANVKAVAARELYSMALKADGTVAVWGGGSCLQTNVPPGLAKVVAIAAGRYAALALKADGTVVAWGNDVSVNAGYRTG
jgi:alpha-tubulin suppressor-like RCC1 family protein